MALIERGLSIIQDGQCPFRQMATKWRSALMAIVTMALCLAMLGSRCWNDNNGGLESGLEWYIIGRVTCGYLLLIDSVSVIPRVLFSISSSFIAPYNGCQTISSQSRPPKTQQQKQQQPCRQQPKTV